MNELAVSVIAPIKESQTIERYREFPASVDIHTLMSYLRECRSTGRLFIDINQGGIGSVAFSERARVTSP